MTFACLSGDFHPYECDGPGHCRHCDRRLEEHHNPEACPLCESPEIVASGEDLSPLVSELEDWEMSR